MAHAYTPGLRVSRKTAIRKKRILPLKGKVLKQVGEKVNRADVVARTELPGGVIPVNIVNLLGIIPSEIQSFMLKKAGDPISKDEVIAETRPFIKWLKTEVKSPIGGRIESISEITGQVLLREPPMPVEVKAYIDGQVIEIIPDEGVVLEVSASFIQGIFGIGGETSGKLKFVSTSPQEKLEISKITPDCRDCIVVGGSFASYEVIRKAIQVGAKGLIVGGIHDGDLRQILGYDLGVAITGAEDVGISLVLTEGFGEIAMAERTFRTLKEREGAVASISGATQIRAGVIRPEIIIPFEEGADAKITEQSEERHSMKIGDSIRVIRQPYFGKIGVVNALPSELKKIESETKARVLEVKFGDGTAVIIPRANVEMIES